MSKLGKKRGKVLPWTFRFLFLRVRRSGSSSGGGVCLAMSDDDAPTIDTFETHNRKVKLQTFPDNVIGADIVSELPLPIEAAWELLVHPDNHKVFRAVKVIISLCCRVWN